MATQKRKLSVAEMARAVQDDIKNMTREEWETFLATRPENAREIWINETPGGSPGATTASSEESASSHERPPDLRKASRKPLAARL